MKKAIGIAGVRFNEVGEIKLFRKEDGRTEGGANEFVVEEVSLVTGIAPEMLYRVRPGVQEADERDEVGMGLGGHIALGDRGKRVKGGGE